MTGHFLYRRREFIALLGGAAAAWPLAARAQQPAMPVIGFLSSYSPGRSRAFRGRVPSGSERSRLCRGPQRGDRIPLGRRPIRPTAGLGGRSGSPPGDCDCRVWRHPAALAAKAATTTIPIVFSTGGDPVKLGLVASLNRPGGNLTGVSILNLELGRSGWSCCASWCPRRPSLPCWSTRPTPTAESLSRDLQAAARALGLQLHVLHASTEREIDTAFAALRQLRAGGLVVGTDPFFNSRSEQLAALTLRHAMPTIYQYREFAAAGGLMSYGGSITDAYRQVGVYTGRILKGDKPAELPVQQSTKVELIINLKTAKALGLTVPPSLLGRADEVIE